MRKTLYGLFVAAALVSGTVRGAEPSSAARDHAKLYQQEVRAALTRHGWRVTQDDVGKLTAEQRWISHDATGFVLADQTQSTYACLQIDFQADGKDHTSAAARASLCIYESPSSPQVGFMVHPPLALRDPKLSQEYFDILAEADSHLTGGHRGVGGSNKVAMK